MPNQFFSNVGNGAGLNIASQPQFSTSSVFANPAVLANIANLIGVASVGAVSGGVVSGGGSTGGSGGSTSTPPLSTPSASPVDMLAALNAIPVAEEGHVITPRYHNSLRDVLILLASQLGTLPSSAQAVISLPAALLPITDSGTPVPAWEVKPGAAVRPAQGNSASGWMPVQLPDGWLIQSMQVTAEREGTVTSCTVTLNRQQISGDSAATLITVSLKNAPLTPDTPVAAAVKGDSVAVVQNYSLVDNSSFNYYIKADLANPAQGATVVLHSIQILCKQF
jgi:hypothetical protein